MDARILALLAASFAVSGCSSMVKTDGPYDGVSHVAAGGVSYYLPKRMFKFVFDRSFIEASLEQGLKAAAANLDKATAAKGDAEKALKSLSTLLANLSPGTPAHDATKKEVDLATAAVALAAKAEAKGQLAYGEAYQKFMADKQLGLPACKLVDKFSIEPLAYVPDTTGRFLANLNHNAFRSDALKLTTTGSGLLTSVKGESQDQTGEVLLALARAYAASSAPATDSLKDSLLAKRATPVAADQDPYCASLRPLRIESIFDPATEFDKIAKLLGSVDGLSPNTRYEIGFQSLDMDAPEPASPASVTLSTRGGLLYRRNMTYVIEISEVTKIGCTLKSSPPISAFTIEFPQSSPAEILPFTSGAFVKTEYDVEFVNGMLTSMNAKRPSEALGIASIPFDILKALVQIPAELIKFRVDYSTQDVALVQQQRLLLCETERLNAAREGRAVDVALCPE